MNKKVLGFDVLLKLMKIEHIEVRYSEKAGKYIFDINQKELINIADTTLKYHNIYQRI